MKRLFGTDGIRGVAGEPPLDAPTVRRFGAALAHVVAREFGHAPRIVLGRDTRESGPWLRDALACGLAAAGAAVVDAGRTTTPGLAHVLRDRGFDAGVMISASHNPFADNGLKAFGPSGMKLSDELERRVEDAILGDAPTPPDGPAPVEQDDRLNGSYVAYLERALPDRDRLKGLSLVLDCANGSASDLAPRVFRDYGAIVEPIGVTPDGRNINLDCGSLHLDRVAAAVVSGGHDAGIAFDGDADRVLAVDRRGRVIDGDHILYFTARQLERRGRLRGNAVVATILSNLWLEQRLAAEGIELHRAGVGDKYVLERMLAEDASLGGEQSGHVIFRDLATTGDGILTGLLLLDALLDEGRPLDELLDEIVPCPQVQINVRVRDKPDLREHPAIGPAVRSAEGALSGAGRVVLRYSGTEPVARVMVEGSDGEAVHGHAERLAAVIREALGA